MSKTKPRTKEYKTFSDALRTVLSVSHSELQARLAAEKAAKRRKPKRASACRVGDSKG